MPTFVPNRWRQSLEIPKDIVAIANSGGGALLQRTHLMIWAIAINLII
jgi:hypothetical protein